MVYERNINIHSNMVLFKYFPVDGDIKSPLNFMYFNGAKTVELKPISVPNVL